MHSRRLQRRLFEQGWALHGVCRGALRRVPMLDLVGRWSSGPSRVHGGRYCHRQVYRHHHQSVPAVQSSHHPIEWVQPDDVHVVPLRLRLEHRQGGSRCDLLAVPTMDYYVQPSDMGRGGGSDAAPTRAQVSCTIPTSTSSRRRRASA